MSKYEAPILVTLGETAKGSGSCNTGSGGAPETCYAGTGVEAGPLDCTAGLSATRDCTAGTAALRDCTAGVSATGTTCSAGDHAASCTAGSLQV
jgi:hypothetical protein